MVTGLALGQRVGELGQMAAGLPDLRREDDAGVEADDVVADLHHRAPPLPLDVVLDLDAQRPVVPGSPEAAIDLAGREDDAPPLRQADDGLHQRPHLAEWYNTTWGRSRWGVYCSERER